MGRRGEQRIAISFPVVVRGFDSRGVPFVVTTETTEISATGACIKDLGALTEPAKKIEVECGDQKAWYRVQWVGQAGTARAGCVGIRCLEPRKYIWGVPAKEWEPDTFDLSPPGAGAPSPAASTQAKDAASTGTPPERRRFSRQACRIEARVTAQAADGTIALDGKITDISLGGCYVEMLSPLPVDTSLVLSFEAGGATLQLSGNVRSSQAGFGMGVAFTGMSPKDFEELCCLAAPAAQPANQVPAAAPKQPGPQASSAKPVSAAVPGADLVQLPATAEAFRAVVRLLLRKGLISRAELTEAIEKAEKQKPGRVPTAAS